MGTGPAVELIEKVAASGANQFVFGGGDPLQRKDLAFLASVAKQNGLGVEVQTNAQLLGDTAYQNVETSVGLWGFGDGVANRSEFGELCFLARSPISLWFSFAI